jgi:hypothetical protein
MISFLNDLQMHDAAMRLTASQLLKSHPMLRSLVNDYVNPKVSNCLPTPQMMTKILTALAEDADIGSSLRSQAHILESESFSNQFDVLCHQVGLDKAKMVSRSILNTVLTILLYFTVRPITTGRKDQV